MSTSPADHTVILQATPGEVLDGRWRIETRIGQGAMGSVFRGRDLTTNALVAVKILAPEHCRKAKVLARFEREAQVMTSLRHPNLVRLLGHGRRGALPYIVMEYLEGVTLAQALAGAGGKLPLAETVAVVSQLAEGLAFLHRAGLVHRDVKPQNVFVADGGRITILDLGVVRDVAKSGGLTRPGALVGTPYYMSPEQVLGLTDLDLRTDVYALSAMTFELLTGRPPYLGTSNFEVLFAHRNSPAPDASALEAGLPKAVGEVLGRGLNKNRQGRQPSATAFASELAAASGTAAVDLSTSPLFALRVAGSEEAPMAASIDVVSDGAEIVNTEMVRTPSLTPVDPHSAKTHLLVTAPMVGGEALQPTQLLFAVGLTSRGSRAEPEPARPVGTVDAELRIRVGRTSGEGPVDASVAIDGVPAGPATRPFRVAPGVHTVRISAPGFRSAVRLVDLTAGSVLSLEVTLQSGERSGEPEPGVAGHR